MAIFYTTGEIPLGPNGTDGVADRLWGETYIGEQGGFNTSLYDLQNQVMGWTGEAPMSDFRSININTTYGTYISGGCFDKDTLLLVKENKYKKISEINVNDNVISCVIKDLPPDDKNLDYLTKWNPSNIKYELKSVKVLNVYNVYSDTQYIINDSIVVTKDHPFLVKNEINNTFQFKSVDAINKDYHQLVSKDLKLIPIKSIFTQTKDLPVMNLKVETDTFIIKYDNIDCVVHNK